MAFSPALVFCGLRRGRPGQGARPRAGELYDRQARPDRRMPAVFAPLAVGSTPTRRLRSAPARGRGNQGHGLGLGRQGPP